MSCPFRSRFAKLTCAALDEELRLAHDALEANRPEHHHIHVARTTFLPLRDRTEYERNAYAVSQGLERLVRHYVQAGILTPLGRVAPQSFNRRSRTERLNAWRSSTTVRSGSGQAA